MLQLIKIPATVQGWENNVALKAALQIVSESYERRLGANVLALPNPWEACFLNQGRPFIDRQVFRNYIQELNKQGGKRFLVVNLSLIHI